MGFIVVAFCFLFTMWLFCAIFYERIWHEHLKLWAVPFAHGLLLFAKRAPESWVKR